MKFYNTMTRSKEPLEPIRPGEVRMYVCGMTVYDYCHLGHARVMVAFDVLARYLRSRGYQLTYVRNITDIDDKIIQRARENGESTEQLTQRYIDAMHEDEGALGVLPPDLEPRATQAIPEMIEMIGKLLDRGHAYVGDNGDVFYAVQSFNGYGKLSGKHLEDLRSGARVSVDDAKRDPLDFVLWKMAKPGEPAWPSPYGDGRPGWHIECSAMSTCCLGNHFDIHGGGMDLQFPHHENEIAQSEGATGEIFANLWLHNGFVRVNEEKMSKSLGNFFTVREVLKEFPPEVVRFFIVSSHYRSPLNYSPETLEEAQAALTRLYTALRGTGHSIQGAATVTEDYEKRFHAAMEDDLNTAEAVSVLFEMARDLNRLKAEDSKDAGSLASRLRGLGGLLGLLQKDPEDYFKGGSNAIGEADEIMAIEAEIAARSKAKSLKDWGEADRIRMSLKARGIVLEDAPGGATTWRRE